MPARMTNPRPLWLILAPAIFLILWSAGFAVAKIGLRHAEPITLLALRYGLVVAALVPAFIIVRPPLPRSLRAWADIAVTGFLIQVVYFALCYFAFKSGVSAGGVAIIVCLQPILVGLAAPWLVGEKVGLGRWAGLVLGLSGAALVIVARSGIAAENP
jgi:drug/metabolite transporter (DMT)-like permease